jgi:hypothetical protein
MANPYSRFLKNTCNGEYTLICVSKYYRSFYLNILLFLFTGQFLVRANSKGVNPDIEGGPEYFMFSQRDVENNGYYLLFVMNMPMYAKKIWNNENAYYLSLMPLRERRKKQC